MYFTCLAAMLLTKTFHCISTGEQILLSDNAASLAVQVNI